MTKKEKNEVEDDFAEDTWIIMEYNDILHIISKTVRDYRKEHNLSQGELAKILETSQPIIAKLESSKYNPSIQFLVKMWNKLSTNEENFGKTLLDKISTRVDKGYNYSLKFKKEGK